MKEKQMKNDKPKSEMKPEGENLLFLDEDEEAVLLQTTVNFYSEKKADHRNALYLSGSEDDLVDKLARAERIINFLFFNILICHERIYPVAHINAVAPEIERLYDTIRKLAKRKGKHINELNNAAEIKKTVMAEYTNHKGEFKYINIDHLNNISFALTEHQERRDFIGPLLENYLKSKNLDSPGAQKLYKIYNQMQKHINRTHIT